MTVEDLQGNVTGRVGESGDGNSHKLVALETQLADALENQLANALLSNEQVLLAHTC